MRPWLHSSNILVALQRLGLCVLVAIGLLQAHTAVAQTIESILAPGKVIQGHAKYEEDCSQCHVKFDRKAQDGLCMSCHKDVGADVKARTGFHGRTKPQACNTCHTDHKGRNARIVELDKKAFDHNVSDYRLRGKHETVECVKCHQAGKRYREAPLDCNSCHRKDDVHKGGLGVKCADCHSESDWKETQFDHDKKTRFSLIGKHADIKCADCHKNNGYKDTVRTCIGCHKKDDDGRKGHQGQYGEKCDSCHGTKAWKPANFNHDTDTKYPLRGKHRATECRSCHSGSLYKVKLSQDCYACHKNDDKHKDTLGKDCGSCHTERSWKEPPKFDHTKTSFPLLGKHVQTECKECHNSAVFKDAPMACFACHKKVDKHEATLGEKCSDCHTEQDWKTTKGRFDHDRTKFQLRNAHAESVLKCNACHKDLKSFRKTSMECFSCHKKDDKHEGQLGKSCETCHSDRDWKGTRFDHAKTKFPLTGKHVPVKCEKCHETSRYKDASSACYTCHEVEDTHKLKFGEKCESCHNTRAWPLWDFNHDKRSQYLLSGAHTKVACESCHTQHAPKNKDIAPVGNNCVSCHRKDDVHDAQFGVRCETCHSTKKWSEMLNRFSGDTHANERDLVVERMPVWGFASYFWRGNSSPRGSAMLKERS